jgi:hypothetical protein
MAAAATTAARASQRAASKTVLADLGISFAVPLDPAAASFLARQSAQLVTRIDAETRRQVRTILTNSATNGWSWGKTARELAARFSAFSARAPGPKALRNRAQLIAVTEVGNAFEEGTLKAAQAIQASGIDLEKRWLTVGDGRVSPQDIENGAAGWIRLGELFPSGHERPLSHPGCRCTLLTRRAEETP